jgi:hypothetical protein
MASTKQAVSDKIDDNFYKPSDTQIAKLQSILQKESKCLISLDDAKEIGIELVALYECLLRSGSIPRNTQDESVR